MAKQTINIGTAPNDGTGDTARDAFDICNDNFTELYDGKLALDGSTEMTGDLVFAEAADHSSTPAAGKGYLWVKSDTPSSLIFTDDAGTDYDLTDITSTPEGTAILSTGEVGGTKFLREDGDGTSSWQAIPAPEGTAILSTGEVGGTKFLREDGDGTCSWQEVAGGVDWSTTQTTTGNFTFKLSDAAGASKLSLTDSADAEVFAVSSDGWLRVGPTPNMTISKGGSNELNFNIGGIELYSFYSSLGASVGPDMYWGWRPSVNVAGDTADVKLHRDAANTLALRNGTNLNEYRVYSTYSDSSNYERLSISGDGVIAHESAGTGTQSAVNIASVGFTVATLPTGSVGMIARVTDADTPAVGSTVTGGGAAAALCWYNGSAWSVIGV